MTRRSEVRRVGVELRRRCDRPGPTESVAIVRPGRDEVEDLVLGDRLSGLGVDADVDHPTALPPRLVDVVAVQKPSSVVARAFVDVAIAVARVADLREVAQAHGRSSDLELDVAVVELHEATLGE